MEYLVKQKWLNLLGDVYDILTEDGKQIYAVRSKLFSLSQIKYLYDEKGKCKKMLRQVILDLLPKYIISDKDNNEICRFEKKFSLMKKFEVKCLDGNKFLFDGNFFAKDYKIFKNDILVAEISKKRFTFRDKYFLRVDDEDNLEFYIMCVIAIDNLFFRGRNISILGQNASREK